MLRKSAASEDAQQWASIVDCAVYTRNRHFRLLGSSKAGKAAVLLPSGRYATAPHAPGTLTALPDTGLGSRGLGHRGSGPRP